MKNTDYQEVKEYWSERAREFGKSAQSTTLDYYMRDIEIADLTGLFAKAEGKNIADVGCGNGYATVELAKRYPERKFYGFDYIPEMIENANLIQKEAGISNVEFKVFDLINDKFPQKFDIIYTDRCLINLPSWPDQQKALAKIAEALLPGGVFIAIENFVEGHNNLNKLRRDFGLPEIAVRDHNLFFVKSEFENFCRDILEMVSCDNISSLYYIISRVIYSKICQNENNAPDYFDIHHELAAKLPYTGDFGPISRYCFRREL